MVTFDTFSTHYAAIYALMFMDDFSASVSHDKLGIGGSKLFRPGFRWALMQRLVGQEREFGLHFNFKNAWDIGKYEGIIFLSGSRKLHETD
jgi:hypothetical protein